MTGSNYLIESGDTRVLIDCGLFQGTKYAEVLNYENFPFDPKKINAVILTHSHIDHAGRLPKLWKHGFRGTIYATKPTIELAKKALPNSLHLIAEEARWDHHEPLYELSDIDGAVNLMKGYDLGHKIIFDNFELTFRNAGHILGSAIAELTVIENGKRTKIAFSGDLGNSPSPLLEEPYKVTDAEYIVVESAYGNRNHENVEERKGKLEALISETIGKGGTLLIPSFAIERAQELLYELNTIIEGKKLPFPLIPVYFDSPLAIDITKVYGMFPEYLNEKVRDQIAKGDDIFDFKGLQFTRTHEESKLIDEDRGPKIIIAGSGMSNGGRILFHEQKYLSDPKSAILFVGYQVTGTLGRSILDKEAKVKIMGKRITIRCRVAAIGGYSAHADQSALLKWIGHAAENPSKTLKKVFVVQGESETSEVLAGKIKETLGVAAHVPSQGELFDTASETS